MCGKVDQAEAAFQLALEVVPRLYNPFYLPSTADSSRRILFRLCSAAEARQLAWRVRGGAAGAGWGGRAAAVRWFPADV